MGGFVSRPVDEHLFAKDTPSARERSFDPTVGASSPVERSRSYIRE